MKKQLTDEQVKELLAFIEKKRVFYYDLQVELLDHLVESIQEEMEKEPRLSFEEALPKVYKGFGIFGFAKIVQEKEQSLISANSRLWKDSVKQFFTIPKIFMTLCVFAVSLFLSQFLETVIREIVVGVFWGVLLLVAFFKIRRWRRDRRKKLLLTRYTQASEYSVLFVYYFTIFDAPAIHLDLVFAALITLAFVTELAVVEVNRYIFQNARQLYPEAFA